MLEQELWQQYKEYRDNILNYVWEEEVEVMLEQELWQQYQEYRDNIMNYV